MANGLSPTGAEETQRGSRAGGDWTRDRKAIGAKAGTGPRVARALTAEKPGAAGVLGQPGAGTEQFPGSRSQEAPQPRPGPAPGSGGIRKGTGWTTEKTPLNGAVHSGSLGCRQRAPRVWGMSGCRMESGPYLITWMEGVGCVSLATAKGGVPHLESTSDRYLSTVPAGGGVWWW